MSETTATCPDDSALRAYLRGDVSDDLLNALAEHLRDCSGCLSRMSDLDRAEAQPLYSSAMTDDDSKLEQAVQRLLDPTHEPHAPPSIAPPPSPGDRIGEYRLLEQIGEGGMGTTFKAVQLKLDRIVALKVLRPALLHDRAAVARFHREMRAIGRLQHPNIVMALDAGEVGGHLYLAMELVPGETLSQRVRRQGALPIEQACRVALAAARALEHAHATGLVHRDVKPSNLMLLPDGSVKLLDMGLVRLLVHEPSTTSNPADVEPTRLSDIAGAIGTSDYMAPEQWRCSSKIDARADQYGLGCTLFYLLVGKPPFSGDNSRTPYDKMQLHLNEPPPSARQQRPEVPPLLDRVIERLLAKNPKDRFANITEVASHLEAVIAGETPAVLPAPPPRSGRRTPRLIPILMGLAALIALTIGAIAFFKTPKADPTQPTQPIVAKIAPKQGSAPMTLDEAVELQRAWAEYAHRPVVEKHPVGMEFVLVPPGLVTVGVQTFVSLPTPYQMSRTEITIGQFRQFVAETGYVTTAESTGGGHLPPPGLKPGVPRPQLREVIWSNPGYANPQDDHPVVQLSWHDAVAYCEWLSAQDGQKYRLPTEWEWIWACRAGGEGSLPFAGAKELPEYAWYRENSEMHPRTGAGRRPNAWGLYDMLGNVHEWIANTPTKLPAGTIVSPPGELDRTWRHVRGGGFDSETPHPGSTERYTPKYAYIKIGFRVLRELLRN